MSAQDFYLPISRMFDTLMSDAFKNFDVPQFASELYSTCQFPPTDVYIDKEKNLCFDLSVSGYKTEDLDIEATGDYLIVTGKKEEIKEDQEEDIKYIKRGIKKGKFIAKYFVPASKYNKDDIKAKMKDGMLNIILSPIADQKPKRISIEAPPT